MSENTVIEKENIVNKSAIKDFAVSARKKLNDRVQMQANRMGFYADNRALNFEFEDDKQVKINGEIFDKKQISILKNQIQHKGFDTVIDEVAYTWFNRFIALYFMEVHNYIDNGLNIISSLDEINSIALKAPSYFKNINKEHLFTLVQDNKSEDVYKTLIIAQCNELSAKLPFLFEQISDYTELLFPQGMLNNDSVIREMLALDKQSWNEVEIIGWLYQYYISEKKDEVFAELKKGKKISKENVPAATQIFTPKWIVQYMVENSVGKMWLEAHPNNELQSTFKYYLESAEQEEDVKAELEKTIDRTITPEKIKVLDPACGSGHILVTAFSVLYEIYKSAGYIEEEIAELILTKNLYGLDICNRAGQLAQLALIMKAREYDKNIFNKNIELNITSIQDTNWIDSRVKEALMNNVSNQLLAQQQIENLVNTFKDAKEYGSILDVKDFDFNFWEERLNAIQTLNMGLLYTDVVAELQQKLPQLIKQVKIMQQKYECVIANPPYMGNKGMSPKLSEYVKKHYPKSKGDMFAVFKEVILSRTQTNYFSSTVNQHSWMFLSSYEDLREHLLNNAYIDTMVHLGTRAFEELAGEVVQTTTYVTRKCKLPKYAGRFVKLTEYQNAKLKEDKYLEYNSKDIYICKQNGFHSIPGSPIAYWASDRVRGIFANNLSLSAVCKPTQGLATADNDRFLRYWQEIKFERIGFNYKTLEDANLSKLKWFPYNKGGNARKWYGNNEYVVNWENNGLEIKNNKDINGKLRSRPQNIDYYFKKGITWILLSSSYFSVRLQPNGFIFDVNGMCAFPNEEKNIPYIQAFMTSKLSTQFLKMLNDTMAFQVGDISKLPLHITKDTIIQNQIDKLVEKNIQISKDDWDSFETSWDFEQHPLIRFKTNNNLKESFNTWKEYKEQQFKQLKANEEELNCLFIEIYGLQDEMTPDVADKDITVALAYEERDIKSLLSYAVGCMFGRYSLDVKGLAFAGGEFDSSKYKSLEVDEDAILPILGDTWFDDDIIEEFKRFLKAAFGELYFNENMQYIADVLGRKSGESAEDKIRNYFLKDFYKDHVQMYKKRPIYWMFTSGKEKAFNCLVYLHRYDKTTLSRLRKDYLHEFQAKLDRAKEQAEKEGNIKLTSQYAKYQSELLEFDRRLQQFADQQIELDLDDGVKVNYAKFKGLLEMEKDIIGKEK